MNSSTTSDQAAAAAEIAAYIAELNFDVMQSYCTTSAIVLLAYHYITTLDDEATHFWSKAVAQKGRVTLAWMLFFGNRYLPIIVYAYQAPWWPGYALFASLSPARTVLIMHLETSPSCAATVISQYILEYSQYALWAAISCFRVHALRKNKVLALLVLLLALVPVFSDAVLATYLTPTIDPVDGCVLDASRLSMKVYDICESCHKHSLARASLNTSVRAVDVFAYTGWILSEVFVVGITLAATHHHKALAGAIGRGRRTLSAVLFQDGLVFFVTIMLLNIVQLIPIQLLRPTVGSNSASTVLTLVDPLISILLTRLYFDLQQTSTSQELDAGTSLTGAEFSFGTLDLDARFAECGPTDQC
ncbi:uncharacterized protein TRAVEDRAFT_53527 [Trametes versicolor FP-101664 SS1]|uniref:uncharacterized protein n=1 Tax=Trametes versicolor (strain FP-101664) TaxID=717944 RepID=UPI000462497D|nr:uncharacterized protein TRAVEDRAFT_53527 [Trametes versicolor FP-101664 SS1]EIW53115.1 hypothetical protein TRAVEDRAFT_53527 [Trametes versicolor FP-101664 SS1]